MNSAPSEQDLQQEAHEFRENFNSVLLSTSSADASPDISYAPCVIDDHNQTCILISRLAQHTKNLLNNPYAALLWIENEEDSRNLFARRRLNLDCVAAEIPHDSDEWTLIINQMQQQHGKMIDVLRNLPDFHLFRFDAVHGNYIRGFAQAWQIHGNDLQIIKLRQE